jgi:hypothetical protein
VLRVCGLDVVNFGVDGFGAGQSYLRYQQMRAQVDHDLVLLLLAPQVDLRRDINTRRDVGLDWPVYAVMPRYIMQNHELVLVADPFSRSAADDFVNRSDWEPLLRQHLRDYDRYYFRALYEEPPVIGSSIIYKITASAFGLLQRRQLKMSSFEPDSEAMVVTRSIVQAMQSDVEDGGKVFILVLLPTAGNLKQASAGSLGQEWDGVAENLCEAATFCIDLAPDLLEIPADEIDTGYDETHFGQNSSRLIAELINSNMITYRLSPGTMADP